MLVVSLDQCAISALALRAAENPILAEICKLLMQGVEDGRVLCPIAPETIAETTGCQSADRIAIHQLHCALANDPTGREVLFFKSMHQLINERTLELVRPVSETIATELKAWVRAEDEALASKIWEEILVARQRMRQRVESQSLVEVHGKPALESLRKAVVGEHALHVQRQLLRLLRDEEPDPAYHMAFGLAHHLVRSNATSDEINSLLKAVMEREWEQIDVVFFRGLLSARLELEWRWKSTPRAYDANDEFDIPRVVVALSEACLFITDRKMAQLCVKSEVDQYSPTKVFGMNELDRALEFLRERLG